MKKTKKKLDWQVQFDRATTIRNSARSCLVSCLGPEGVGTSGNGSPLECAAMVFNQVDLLAEVERAPEFRKFYGAVRDRMRAWLKKRGVHEMRDAYNLTHRK